MGYYDLARYPGNDQPFYGLQAQGLDGKPVGVCLVPDMARALAREVGRRGITVNSVAPGYIEIEMTSDLAPQQRAQIINRTPLGRLAKVDDIVPVVKFLVARDSRFITGQTLIVDGGITC